MKKSLLLLFAIFATLLASAQVEIDGIWYNLHKESKTAEVTSSPAKYRGDLIIPSTANYAGAQYQVTIISDNAFTSCNTLESIIIPEGVTHIGENAFSSCHLLNHIIIPKGVKCIGRNAFYNCKNLEAIVLPNGLECVAHTAFAFCSSLTNIYCYAENVPSAAPDAFDGSNQERAILHVSPSAIADYKSTSPWNKFSNVETDKNTTNTNKPISVQGTFDLNGRSISNGGLPIPDTVEDEGRVVVNITVSPEGEVIATSINKRTNTVNPDLRRTAEDAAKRAHFDKSDNEHNQMGTITYYFKLR